MGQGLAIREKPLALRVETDEHGLIWIPKSVIHEDSEVYKKDTDGELLVHTWWAEKNGYA